MKISNKSFARKTSYFKFALFALAIAGLVVQSKAQLYTINNNNSSLDVDVASGPGGVNNWKIDGVDQLNLQWFYYRVGSAGPEYPIQTINGAPLVTSSSLDVTYANGAYSVRTVYSLTGGNAGSGSGQLNETITINNTSATALDFHFYQYSDFDLGNVTGGQAVQFYKNGSGLYYKAIQNNGSRMVTETVTPASHIEAALYNQTFASLADGSPTILNDVASAGLGNVTFAFQWDRTINPGDSFLISKLIGVVPEPSCLALVSSGMFALAVSRRRKK
jgi:large repetitive protein